MTNQAALIVLRSARECIASGWTQHVNARNIAGRIVYEGYDIPVESGPVCWCLSGAIHHAIYKFTHLPHPRSLALGRRWEQHDLEVFVPLAALVMIARARATYEYSVALRYPVVVANLSSFLRRAQRANDDITTRQSDVLLWLDIAIARMMIWTARNWSSREFRWTEHLSIVRPEEMR